MSELFGFIDGWVHCNYSLWKTKGVMMVVGGEDRRYNK